MPPMPAPGHLCLGWVAHAGDDLLGHPQSHLALPLVGLAPCRGGCQLHCGWSLSPCHPVSPSLGTFPDVDHPASAVVQHKAVIRAEQALAERAAGDDLGQVHAPCHIQHLPMEGMPLRGHLGPLQPSVLSLPISHSGIPHPCLFQGLHGVPSPCSAPCGFPKGHQCVPGPCPTSCALGSHHGVPWLCPASCTSWGHHGVSWLCPAPCVPWGNHSVHHIAQHCVS